MCLLFHRLGWVSGLAHTGMSKYSFLSTDLPQQYYVLLLQCGSHMQENAVKMSCISFILYGIHLVGLSCIECSKPL